MANLQSIIEEWKDIPGYEGKYQVSSLGQVKSLPHIINMRWGNTCLSKPRILVPRIDSRGYYYMVSLWQNNKGKNFLLHRLVAEMHIPNPDELPEVNHKWGDKADNRAVALEWCTKAENNQHAHRTGLSKTPPPRYGKDNKSSKRVKDPATGKVYETVRAAAADMGIRRQLAGKICIPV